MLCFCPGVVGVGAGVRYSVGLDQALQILPLDAPLLSWVTASQGPFDGHNLQNPLNESIMAAAFNLHNNVSVKINIYIYIFKVFLSDTFTCPIWGHWYPCFGFLVTSPLGFKARVVLPNSHCGGECSIYWALRILENHRFRS